MFLRVIDAGKQRRERGSPTRLDDDAQHPPERFLCRANRVIGDQHDSFDSRLGDREIQRADSPRRERIGGDATGFGVDRATGLERPGECRRQLRLHPDESRARLAGTIVPDGGPADQSAPADGDEKRLQVRRLLLELGRDGAGAEERLDLIVGVHAHRARGRDPAFARGEGVGISVSADHEIGAVASDLVAS